MIRFLYKDKYIIEFNESIVDINTALLILKSGYTTNFKILKGNPTDLFEEIQEGNFDETKLVLLPDDNTITISNENIHLQDNHQ